MYKGCDRPSSCLRHRPELGPAGRAALRAVPGGDGLRRALSGEVVRPGCARQPRHRVHWRDAQLPGRATSGVGPARQLGYRRGRRGHPGPRRSDRHGDRHPRDPTRCPGSLTDRTQTARKIDSRRGRTTGEPVPAVTTPRFLRPTRGPRQHRKAQGMRAIHRMPAGRRTRPRGRRAGCRAQQSDQLVSRRSRPTWLRSVPAIPHPDGAGLLSR